MQPPRLIASDVDGTLLDPTDRVTARTVAAIERLVAAGSGFVLVTGRPPRWIQPIREQVGVVRLAVCANGALIYDAVADEVLWARTMDPDTLAVLAEAAMATLPDCGLAVERSGPAGDGSMPSFIADAEYLHAWDTGLQVHLERFDRAALLAEPAVKLLVRCPRLRSEEMLAQLAPVIGTTADLTFSTSKGLIEISPNGVTKATGLAEVARRLDVAAADVIAFGDMPNDIEMLRWAGRGVAMGNAHPALLAVADEVAPSNGDDGIAVVLERFLR
ncbi:HAD family hydrolase [Pseudonocardia sp. GCM10023141]|uniref:HAD family hydrolase n=1 Tax=Pseudonocardia sp. GCM10023141 TaxID=3252653 RepID=UPI00360F4D5A